MRLVAATLRFTRFNRDNRTTPILISEWGVLDEPSLGPSFYASVRQGGFAETFAHSARANKDGTRVYVSYGMPV